MTVETRVNKLRNSIQNQRTRQPDGKYESAWMRLKRENPHLRFYRDWNHIPLNLVTADRAFHLKIVVGVQPVGYMLGYGSFFVHPLYLVDDGVPFDPPYTTHVD